MIVDRQATESGAVRDVTDVVRRERTGQQAFRRLAQRDPLPLSGSVSVPTSSMTISWDCSRTTVTTFSLPRLVDTLWVSTTLVSPAR